MRSRSLSLPIALAVATLSLAACDRVRDVDSAPDGAGEPTGSAAGPGGVGLVASPEAVSRSGRLFRPLDLDPAAEARMLAQLDSAEAAYRADPDDPEALIWVGRRLGYLGRYQEAIEAFGEGVDRHRDDPRFYRHRGHRFITVREFDRAIEDLELAARLVTGKPDEVEPDGQPNEAGIPRSTLQTNIWYHLGLARYLVADFRGAAHAFQGGFQLSANDDMRVAMADWLWLALKRLGRNEAAEELLDSIRPDMEILENDAYHRRLLMYKGVMPPDSLFPGAGAWLSVDLPARPAARSDSVSIDPLTLATYGYGLGAYALVNGDRERARALFEAVKRTGYWPAFGYIAAEAELARMRPSPSDTGGGGSSGGGGR